MTTLVLTVLIIVLVYAFQGIISFIPFLVGLVINVFQFPLDFLSHFYPVGDLPYIICFVFPLFLLVMFIIELFKE